VPFLLVHLVPLLALVTGVTARAVVLCAVLYVAKMFFITAGYHRYFAHRSYRTSRAFQFVLAFGGTTAAQKGPLWWASHHRHHHRHSDTEQDVHSPLKGFWHSHVGWILAECHKGTDLDAVKDLAKFPELRFLNKHDWIGPWSLAVVSYLVAGWSGLVVGFFLSTVLTWHGTFLVNSLAHVFGRRRFATTDTSRNSALIALVTLGEGWHNNHHHYQASARQGFYWWELDVSYYVLRLLSMLRIVRDLKAPSPAILASARVSTGSFDVGMFRAYWTRAHAAVARSGSAGKAAVEDAVTASLQAAEDYATRARRPRAEQATG
jgi:stearoyl-CoA desaturase (delta-9 desaturase)